MCQGILKSTKCLDTEIERHLELSSCYLHLLTIMVYCMLGFDQYQAIICKMPAGIFFNELTGNVYTSFILLLPWLHYFHSLPSTLSVASTTIYHDILGWIAQPCDLSQLHITVLSPSLPPLSLSCFLTSFSPHINVALWTWMSLL